MLYRNSAACTRIISLRSRVQPQRQISEEIPKFWKSSRLPAVLLSYRLRQNQGRALNFIREGAEPTNERTTSASRALKMIFIDLDKQHETATSESETELPRESIVPHGTLTHSGEAWSSLCMESKIRYMFSPESWSRLVSFERPPECFIRFMGAQPCISIML